MCLPALQQIDEYLRDLAAVDIADRIVRSTL